MGDGRYIRPIYSNANAARKEPAFYQGATFVNKPNFFQMTYGSIHLLLQVPLLTHRSDPIRHSARRKLSSPSYSLQSVARLDGLIKERGEALSRRLLQGTSSSPAGTANAYEACGLFSFEVICKAAFAKEFTNEQEAVQLMKAMDGSALTFIFNSLMPFIKHTNLGSLFPGPFGDCYRSPDEWRVKSRKMVDHFLQHKMDDKYLLTPLVKGVDQFLGRKLTHEELVEEAMGYMIAGSGTTSTTLTYLLYALSRPENTQVQRRLHDEIMALPADDITEVRRNPYVNAVIKETFRLHPTIIPTLPRVLTEPLQLEKFLLPAGTVVGMQNFIHHRDAAVFPEPENFLPERWLQSSEAMDASLTPFGIGKRNCIGQNLAWQEIYWAISCIVRAGLELKLGAEMQAADMHMDDRFNIAPHGRKLMLEVTRKAPKASI